MLEALCAFGVVGTSLAAGTLLKNPISRQVFVSSGAIERYILTRKDTGSVARSLDHNGMRFQNMHTTLWW